MNKCLELFYVFSGYLLRFQVCKKGSAGKGSISEMLYFVWILYCLPGSFPEQGHAGLYGFPFILPDFWGRFWWELKEEEQESYAAQRGEGHNSVLKYEESFYENRQILKDYVHFLYLNDVKPVVVIPPFSAAYNRHVDKRLKEAVIELVQSPVEALSFVDFNEETVFDNYDFIDMDHLNEQGAKKMSRLLAEKFGK